MNTSERVKEIMTIERLKEEILEREKARSQGHKEFTSAVNKYMIDGPAEAVVSTLGDFGSDPLLRPNVIGHREDYSSPEGARDAVKMGLDPYNLLGLGLFGKGQSMLRNLGVADDAGKGMLTAPADNYIPNFYVPRESGENTLVEKAIKPILRKTSQGKNLNAEQMVGASQRAASTGRTVAKAGINSFLDLLDPRARALWKKEHVSQTGQDIITKHMTDYEKLTDFTTKERARLNNGTGKKLSKENEKVLGERVAAFKKENGIDRPLPKAGAEAIYQGHQRWQAGGTIDPNTTLGKYLDKAFLQQYTEMGPNTLHDIFQNHHATIKASASRKGTGEAVKISTNDATFAQDLIRDYWPGTNTVVVKRPEAIESGKHLMDIVGKKSPAMSAYNKAFKDLPPNATNDDLAAALQAQNKTNSVNQRFPIKVIRDADGGVWISSTRPGSAIVEGGYRAFHKVETDGKFFGIMSDEHDFLEKAPVLGKAVGAYLPNKLLAVTPPIHGDITKKVAYDQAGAARKFETGDTMANDLTAITELTPDKAIVKAEATKQAGLMTAAGNAAFGEDAPQTATGLPMALLNNEEQAKRRGMLAATGEVSPTNSKPFYEEPT